jgi:uncharacterized protein YraI
MGLIVSATLSIAPTLSTAQSEDPAEARTQARSQKVKEAPPPTRPQTPSPVSGTATVIGVDQPEKCLRIRSGPGKSYEIIGCAKVGAQLNITGVWTSNNWAQLADKGWVYGPQIKTESRPPTEAYSQPGKYLSVKGLYPEYDPGYLPDYGYATYRRGSSPTILYDVNVWRKYHPWWWSKDKVWDPSKKQWVNKPTGSAVQTKAETGSAPASAKSIHKGKVKPRRFTGSASTGFGPSDSRIRFGASGQANAESRGKVVK